MIILKKYLLLEIIKKQSILYFILRKIFNDIEISINDENQTLIIVILNWIRNRLQIKYFHSLTEYNNNNLK